MEVQIPFSNVLRKQKMKNGMEIAIPLYEVMENEKRKQKFKFPVFNVLGKRKTFSNGVGKQKLGETGSLNSVFLGRKKTVGTKVHAFFTHPS